MSFDFDTLKWDVFNFGDNSLYKGDKINFKVKNKDQFIRNFARKTPSYKNYSHVTLRQVATHIRKSIWINLADMDRRGNIREPLWNVATNEEDIHKALDSLTEGDVQIHTYPEELEEFLSYFPPDSEPYLFPLEPNGKDPLEDYAWAPGISKKTGKPYPGTRVSKERAIELEREGYNMGIAGTDQDKLSIMDKDDVDAVGVSKFTLANKSRKQIGEHHFYFTDDPTINGKISTAHSAKQNIPTGTAGEIRAVWQYVVACGSYVPCTETDILAMPEEDRQFAGHYRLYQRAPIATITYNELPEVYKKQVEHTRYIENEKEKQWVETQKREKPIYSGNGSAMWKLSLYDVTGLRDNPGVNFQIPSEFGHGSDTGKNCTVSNGLLTCWRHQVKHNGITALAVYSGAANCEDGIRHGSHHTGINFQEPEVQFRMWEYAYRHGLIPKGEKIPDTALRHYALKKKLCTKEQIIDGWKLPSFVPHLASVLAAKEGLIFGR